MRHWVFALMLLLAARLPAAAATRAEANAFRAAALAFSDGNWARAERELGEFVLKYPRSERRAEAILLQAQARCRLGDFAGAAQLLAAEQTRAGPLADQFLFWLGEARFQQTNYPAAAEAFGRLVAEFPTSALRLEAAVSQAAALARLGQWTRVGELLGEPAGAFQQLAGKSPHSSAAARGWLLRAEALLERGDFAAAERALQALPTALRGPELDWQRQHLLCRAWLGATRLGDALQGSSNLIALARQTARTDRIAESIALQAGTLERLGRLDEAAAVYRLNLAAGVPQEMQRQALLKVGQLALAQDKPAEALPPLEQFVTEHADSGAADMAWLTLGELRLKLLAARLTGAATNLAAPPGLDTNLLYTALTNFDTLLRRFPASPLAAKAQLNRGWCWWLAGDLGESGRAFGLAAQRLPPSPDQVIARFKLADVLFAQGDLAGALHNYQAVVDRASPWPQVRESLLDLALYQALRVSLELRDLSAATNALRQILESFPRSLVADRSVLLVGQGYADAGDPDAARALFAKFTELFPDSELRPEVELAIARTYERQGNWPAAVRQYEAWLARAPDRARQPRTFYALALASYRAGDETNALNQFTNFIAQFPADSLAAQARWWVADHYFNHQNFVDAEKHYQLLFLTWPTSPLAYQARMMAGRAAVARQMWSDAIGYFTNLTSDLNCPADLKVQAILAYGDVLRRAESAETNNPANLEEAIRVFNKVLEINPTNAAAARAWGEIGNCYLQLAARDPNQYTNAAAAYHRVVESPGADVAARSQALVGLGVVAEKLAERATGAEQAALLKTALDRYLDVFYETHLRASEQADLFWLKRAGLDAARLAETLQDWPHALRIYERLQTLLPPLKPSLNRKIEKVRERLTQAAAPPAGPTAATPP